MIMENGAACKRKWNIHNYVVKTERGVLEEKTNQNIQRGRKEDHERVKTELKD